MSITNTSLVPEIVDRGFDPFRGRAAIGGYLAGYTGQTFDAYALDLRQWACWCAEHDLDIFEVRRAHIELFARWLEETGRVKATVGRRLSTITGFYRYCTEEAPSPSLWPRMCEGRRCRTSRTRLGSTATNWACSWSKPDCPVAETMPWHVCWRSTGCGSQKPSEPTSNTWQRSGGIAPLPSQGRAGRS